MTLSRLIMRFRACQIAIMGFGFELLCRMLRIKPVADLTRLRP